MAGHRILLLGLDGFDVDLAERFAGEGLLPNFARLQTQGACFDLDAGRDKYSGLAWEHFSSGIRPSDGGRWSAVDFDKRTYQATQDQTVVRPFLPTSPPKPSFLTFLISTFLLASDVPGHHLMGKSTIPVSFQPHGPMAFKQYGWLSSRQQRIA